MTYSEIQITFNTNLVADEQVNFNSVFTGITPNASTSLNEIFKADRTQTGEASIGINTENIGEISAINYLNAFSLDYNNSLLYEVSRSLNVVTIKSTNPEIEFEIQNPDNNTSNVSIVINNDLESLFQITDVTISAASNPCDNVSISVTTSLQATNIVNPITGFVGSNPYVFETSRSSEIPIKLSQGERKATGFYSIPKLLDSYFDINIINQPSTSSINIIRKPPLTGGGLFELLLTFEYSIDNINWQTSNNFPNLETGNYTAYIRDNIGCSISIAFEIVDFTPNVVDYDAICQISKVNPFYFKKNESWSNCGIRKNPNNTLSYEYETDINNRSFKHWVQNCDTITNQIKSNYSTNRAFLIDCDGNENELTVIQKTENLNITDVRDCRGFKVSTTETASLGKLAVYFLDGLTYDPVTSLENGSYNLDGELMDWLNIGDFVNLQGFGWYEIINILPESNTYPYKKIVLNVTTEELGLSNFATDLIITSAYNVLDFNRYEFNVDFSIYNKEYYYIRVDFEDETFDNCSFTSEWIWNKECHEKHYLIDYYNTVNNEINFSTGVRFRIREPYIKPLTWKPNEEQDIYVTDTRTIPLENKLRNLYDYSPRTLPGNIAKQRAFILAQDRLFFNGISYVKEGDVEYTSLGTTNKGLLKATLVEENYVFDSGSSNGVEEILLPTGQPLEVNSSNGGLLFVN